MVRNIQEFVDKSDADLQWRKHELTTLKLEIQRTKNTNMSQILCRSAICLLYGHWEGFIKKSTDMYLSLIESKNLNMSDLKAQYSAIVLFSALKSCVHSNKITLYASAVDLSISIRAKKFRVGSFKFEIDGNLNYERLYEILYITDYVGDIFEINRAFIDEKMLSKRNSVAHGDKIEVTIADYLMIHDRILMLLENFRNHIQNCAVLERYRG